MSNKTSNYENEIDDVFAEVGEFNAGTPAIESIANIGSMYKQIDPASEKPTPKKELKKKQRINCPEPPPSTDEQKLAGYIRLLKEEIRKIGEDPASYDLDSRSMADLQALFDRILRDCGPGERLLSKMSDMMMIVQETYSDLLSSSQKTNKNGKVEKQSNLHTRLRPFQQLEARLAMAADLAEIATVVQNDIAVFAQIQFDQVSTAELARLTQTLTNVDKQLSDATIEKTSAQASLDTWNASTQYQRSGYNMGPQFATLSPANQNSLRKIYDHHSYVFARFFEQVEPMIACKDAGNTADYRAYYNYIQGMINEFYQRGNDWGRAFAQYGLPLPGSPLELENDLRGQKGEEALRKSAVTVAENKVNTTKAQKTSLTAQKNANPLDLRPQAPTLDGNTSGEMTTWDSGLEKWMSEELGTPVSMYLSAGSITDRLVKRSGRFEGTLTSVEADTLFKDIASRYAQYGNNPENVKSAVRDRLLASPVGEILTKSVQIQEEEKAIAFSNDVSRVLAEQMELDEGLPYARTHVTLRNEGSAMTFSIRFANPGEKTFIEAYVIDGDGTTTRRATTIEHGHGTTDSTWEFTLDSSINRSGGPVHINIYGNTNRTPLLDTIEGFYRGSDNVATLFTEQLDWDAPERGRMVESPVSPDLSIVQLQGNNVIAAFQSPNDQTYIAFEGEGMLGKQKLTHEGGTPFGLSMLTFNAANNTGDYALRMYDRANGRVLDAVMLHWDKTSGTLSMTNAADLLSSNPPEGSGAQLETFNKILSLDTAAADDRQVNLVEQIRTYEATAQLDAPYDFYYSGEDLTPLIYSVKPEFDPQNFAAEVTRRYEANKTYTVGFYENQLHNEASRFFDDMRDGLAQYEEAMGVIMQRAVDMFVRLRHGANERQELADISNLIAYCNTHYAHGALSALGIVIPTRNCIVEAAHRIFDATWQKMIQAEEAVDEYRKSLLNVQKLSEAGFVRGSDGAYKVPRENLDKYFASLMRDEGVSTLVALQERLQGEGRSKDALLNLIASATGSALDQRGELIAEINRASDTEVGGVSIVAEDGSDNLPETAYAALEVVNKMSQDGVFRHALESYKESNGILRKSFPIRTDTALGQIMYGAAEGLKFAETEQKRWEIAIELQRITDIQASKFIGIYDRSATEPFEQKLTELLKTGQYGHLFETYRITENPYVTSAKPNIPATEWFYDGSNPVRLRFDIATKGMAIEKIEVIDDGLVVARSGPAAYIKFPAMSSGDNQKVIVKVSFVNGTSAEIESDRFNIRPVSLEQKLSAEKIIGTDIWKTLKEADKIRMASALSFEGLENLPKANKDIMNYLITHYLGEGAEDRLTYQNSNELRGRVHGTEEKQCKEWISKIVFDVLGIRLPLNETRKGETGAWESTQFEIGRKEENETFQKMLEVANVKSGDIIQMYGRFGAHGSLSLHTMIIAKMNNDGVWVLDTNYGPLGEYLPTSIDATHFNNPENPNQYLTLEEARELGIEAKPLTHYYQYDNTVRLRFSTFEKLNLSVQSATIHRITK